jgi:hypothetical protein
LAGKAQGVLMTNEIKEERSGFLQFLSGFFLGVVVFGVIAAASTYYLQSHHYCSTNRFSSGVNHCIPAFEYAFLWAASWGPSALAFLANPSLHQTRLVMQIISAAVLGIISGIVFIFQSDRSPLETFAIIYIGLITFTAFLILMIVTAG